jgi:hypothetical protein
MNIINNVNAKTTNAMEILTLAKKNLAPRACKNDTGEVCNDRTRKEE